MTSDAKELTRWLRHLSAERRPTSTGITFSACEFCGWTSRTGVCVACIGKKIVELEKRIAAAEREGR